MAVVNVSCKNLLEEQKEAVSSEPKKKKQKVCSKEINESLIANIMNASLMTYMACDERWDLGNIKKDINGNFFKIDGKNASTKIAKLMHVQEMLKSRRKNNVEHFDRAQTKRLYLSLTKKGLADFSVMNMDQYNRWLNPEENNLKSSKTFCVLKANRKEKIILVENPKIVLSQVLKELDIEHNYSIIKSKTLNEVKVCLLIESVPCWSFIGGGITNDEANDNVAQQALQFFLLLSVETKPVKTDENSNTENKRNLI